MPCRPAVSCGTKHPAQFMDEKIVAHFLKNVVLFAEFDGEELQVLGESVQSSRYLPGDSVLEEGSANRALHILKSGRIRVSRKVQDREVALCDLEAGQTFGELSIIEDGVASADRKSTRLNSS